MDGDCLDQDTPSGTPAEKKLIHTCHTGDLTPEQERENELLLEALAECERLGVDPEKIIPPDPSNAFPRILVMQSGPKISERIKQCKELFPVRCYWPDPDNQIVSERETEDAPYAIRLRDRIAPDEELKEVSAVQLLTEHRIKAITLAEAIEHEYQYFLKTGGHLGGGNLTMCAGSRDRHSFKKHVPGYAMPIACILDLVPYVAWRHGALCIDWCHAEGASPYLRARQVITL